MAVIRRGRPPRGWARKFLAELRKTANVSASARAAGVDRKTAYRRYESDATFAAEWVEAMDESTDALEAEARRRGLEGWLEPVFQKGEHVGEIRKYDSGLLALLLRAHRPERFRESYDVAKHTGSAPAGGGDAGDPAGPR